MREVRRKVRTKGRREEKIMERKEMKRMSEEKTPRMIEVVQRKLCNQISYKSRYV